MNKPTPGPWYLNPRADFQILANDKDGELLIGEARMGLDRDNSDGELIVAAVNACFAINPDNPMAVAKRVEPMWATLCLIITGYKNGTIHLPAYVGNKVDELLCGMGA